MAATNTPGRNVVGAVTLLVFALLACGPPQGGPAPATQQNAASEAGPKGCSNDFQCGFGSKCAKDSLAMQGVCAKSVDAYGLPTFEGPDPGSIGPGQGSCSFDTECPIGFRCVKTSGGLRGNCMK